MLLLLVSILQHLILLLLIVNFHFTMWQLKILVSIVLNNFHHVATHDPGHGTKFVTLPSSLLCCEFCVFIKIGSICHCNR